MKAAEIVGRAVATIVESKQETRMQSASPKKTAMTFFRGSRFVWSVRETVSERRPSATVVASSWTLLDTSGVVDRGVETAVPGEAMGRGREERGGRRNEGRAARGGLFDKGRASGGEANAVEVLERLPTTESKFLT